MRRAGVGLLCVVLLSVLLCAAQPAGPPQREPWKAAISGRVVGSDDGKPQRDATVTLSGSALDEPRSSSTDDHGAYRFTGLRPGRYLVAVTPSPHRPGYLGTARKLAAPAALVVDVRAGETTDTADVELQPAVDVRLLSGPLYRITGLVVRADGRLSARRGVPRRVGRRPAGAGVAGSSGSPGVPASGGGESDRLEVGRSMSGGLSTDTQTRAGAGFRLRAFGSSARPAVASAEAVGPSDKPAARPRAPSKISQPATNVFVSCPFRLRSVTVPW
jgi:hypothetical protein